MYVLRSGESEKEFFKRIDREVRDYREMSAEALSGRSVSVVTRYASFPSSVKNEHVAIKFRDAFFRENPQRIALPSRVEVLQFERCAISDFAALEIAAFIRNSNNLRALRIAYGKISKVGLREISDACRESDVLQILSLTAGKRWEDDVVIKILSPLLENSLRILSFNGFKNLSSVTFVGVEEFIKRSKKLSEVNLHGNMFDLQQVNYLFNAIAASGVVHEFGFDSPKLNLPVARMIIGKIARCESLNYLKLPEIENDFGEVCSLLQKMILESKSICFVKTGNMVHKEELTNANRLKIKGLFLKKIVRFYPTSKASEIFSENDRRFLWNGRGALQASIGESEIFQVVTSLRKLIPAVMHRILTSEHACEILRDAIRNRPVYGDNHEEEAYARRALRNYYLYAREKILKGQFGPYLKKCLVDFEDRISVNVGSIRPNVNIEFDYDSLAEPQIYELMQKNPDEYDASEMASMLYEANLEIYAAFKKQQSFAVNCPGVHEEFFEKMQEFVRKHAEAIKNCEFLSESYQHNLRAEDVEPGKFTRRVRRRVESEEEISRV